VRYLVAFLAIGASMISDSQDHRLRHRLPPATRRSLYSTVTES